METRCNTTIALLFSTLSLINNWVISSEKLLFFEDKGDVVQLSVLFVKNHWFNRWHVNLLNEGVISMNGGCCQCLH